MIDAPSATLHPTIAGNASAARYVGFWARVLASIVDTVLLLLITAPITWIAFGRNDLDATSQPANPADVALSVLLPAMIVIVFWIRSQGTPGKWLIAARIVDARTGGRPTTRQCALRYVGYYLSGIVFGLGFLWVAFDRRKQGWHDKLAETVVVRVDDTPGDRTR